MVAWSQAVSHEQLMQRTHISCTGRTVVIDPGAIAAEAERERMTLLEPETV
jgi:hypothetical protein